MGQKRDSSLILKQGWTVNVSRSVNQPQKVVASASDLKRLQSEQQNHKVLTNYLEAKVTGVSQTGVNDAVSIPFSLKVFGVRTS